MVQAIVQNEQIEIKNNTICEWKRCYQLCSWLLHIVTAKSMEITYADDNII